MLIQHPKGKFQNKHENRRKLTQTHEDKNKPCFAYCLALKMEMKCFPKTSVNFQRTAKRYITQDITLQEI
jgi:hypothetical protein